MSAATDTLLTEIAGRLTASLGETDTVARLGGDEFAILVDGAADLPAVVTAAWKIQQACESPFVIDDEVVRVSTSIGIALFPEHGSTTRELLHHADLAMYDAKRSGTSYAVYDAAQEQQLAQSLTQSLVLLADLRDCVERDELVVHYQPVIDLATHHTTGVEALVRWRHPHHGLLQPGSFLPEAERTQVITPLTRWVLNDALRQQQAWRGDGIDLKMAVNIAARTLKPNGDLADIVAELTRTWDTPGRLTLELTESMLIEAAAPATWLACTTSGASCRSTTTAPDTRRWPTCNTCRSTSSRSTNPSSRTSPPPATTRSSSAPSSTSRTTSA